MGSPDLIGSSKKNLWRDDLDTTYLKSVELKFSLTGRQPHRRSDPYPYFLLDRGDAFG